MPQKIREPCFDYFNCKAYDCIRREDLSRQCWEIDDVQCQSHSQAFDDIKKQFNSKLEACKLCLYYQSHH